MLARDPLPWYPSDSVFTALRGTQVFVDEMLDVWAVVDAQIFDVGAYTPAKLVYVPDDIGPMTDLQLRRG